MAQIQRGVLQLLTLMQFLLTAVILGHFGKLFLF